ELGGEIVESDIARIKQNDAVYLFERVRHRERSEPTVADGGPAQNHRRIERAAHLSGQLRAARTADVSIEALQDAQVRAAACQPGDAARVQVERAGDVQLGAVTDKSHVVHAHDVLRH